MHDAQYSEDEYRDRIGWGHSSVADAVAFSRVARAGRLLLFHHDPSHSDEIVDEILAHCRALAAGENMEIESAAEGSLLEVGGS